MKTILITIIGIILAVMMSPVSGSAYDIGAGIEVHGFGSQGWVTGLGSNNNYVTDSSNGSFHFNEFGINFAKQITPELRAAVQISAYDRGDYGRDKLYLDWAFGDYRWKDWLGFRAGKMKTTQGFYLETIDNEAARPFIFLPQSIYPEAVRELMMSVIGFGIYGTVPMGRVGSVAYQFYGGTVQKPDTDSGIGLYLASALNVSSVTNIEPKNMVVLYSEYRPGPVPGLRLAGTFANTGSKIEIGPVKIDGGPVYVYIASAEYAWRDLLLAAEYRWMSSVNNTNTGLRMEGKQAGWYISATYRWNDWFETGAYHSELYSDWNHPYGSDWQERGLAQKSNAYQIDTALALGFDIIKGVKIKVEGHVIRGSASMFATEYEDAKTDSYLVAMKVSYAF